MLEGQGQAVVIDSSTSADSVTVGTASDNRVIITFDELTNVTAFERFGLLLNDVEYYVYMNSDNQLMIREVAVLADDYEAGNLAIEGIEKLINVMTGFGGGPLHFTGWEQFNESIDYNISEDGSDIAASSFWVTQEIVDTFNDVQAEAMQVMREGKTITAKYEAQRALYEAIKRVLDSAKPGLME